MAWQILKDHIAEPDEPSRQFEVGTQTQVPIPALAIGIRPEGLPASKDGVELPKVKFKLFDDDGELYYEGRLHDDDECLNQSAALDFGMAGAGCTTIKVLRDGEWVQEIG